MTIFGSDSSSTHTLSGTDILIVIVCDSQLPISQLLFSTPFVEILFWIDDGDDFGNWGATGFKTLGGKVLAGAFVIYLPLDGCWIGDFAAGGRYFSAGGRYFSGGVILGSGVGGDFGRGGTKGAEGVGGGRLIRGIFAKTVGGIKGAGVGLGGSGIFGILATVGGRILGIINGVIGFLSAEISESNPRHPSGKKYLKFPLLSWSSSKLRINDASLKYICYIDFQRVWELIYGGESCPKD